MKNLLSLFVAKAHAQSLTNNLFTDRFVFNTNNNPNGLNALLSIVVSLLDWFLVAATIIAFIYLVIYGIKYVTSGGDAAKATEARNGIINAIIGIIVIALAFFIIGFAISIAGNPTNTPS